jgi:hypothetical protein
MANTVTVRSREATVSVTRVKRCATQFVVRSGESRTVNGTERRSLVRLESDASLALATNSEFIFGC